VCLVDVVHEQQSLGTPLFLAVYTDSQPFELYGYVIIPATSNVEEYVGPVRPAALP